MVKSHHLYHSSHSYRQSKHILKSQFVCWRVCPGWGALWWVSDWDAQTRALPGRLFKMLQTGGRSMTFPNFFSYTGVKLYQFSKDLKGGQNCRILQWPSYSEYPPRGCVSIFWRGYWVYGVLFRVPRVLYRNLSVVWIWKLSVLAMWCKLVKTFRSERSP